MLRRLLIGLAHGVGLNPRGLFRYYDGRRHRRGDPMVIARRLWAVKVMKESGDNEPFESLESLKLVKSGIGTKIQQGYAEIAEATRYAFELRPFESGGLTENECEKLLADFEDFLGDVKKNGNGLPIGSTNTNAFPTDDSVTSKSSDSTSISGEGNYETPETSDLDSRLVTTL